MLNWLSHRCYLHGYQHRKTPRLARRIFARSLLHRAWLSGKNGYFIEGDVAYGLCLPYSGRQGDSEVRQGHFLTNPSRR